jgi:hypothetical protein
MMSGLNHNGDGPSVSINLAASERLSVVTHEVGNLLHEPSV